MISDETVENSGSEIKLEDNETVYSKEENPAGPTLEDTCTVYVQ